MTDDDGSGDLCILASVSVLVREEGEVKIQLNSISGNRQRNQQKFHLWGFSTTWLFYLATMIDRKSLAYKSE